MTTRKYSSRSQQTTLTGSINSTDTSVVVVSGSALAGGITISPGQTFTVVIDPDTALEEIVDVTAINTNTLTIVRGIDGSTGQAHSAGAVVRHMAIGRDYREANTHIEASAGIHGVTGSVVGTTDTQTLTNKTLTTPTIGSFTNATHNHTNAAGGGTLTSAAISDFQEAVEDTVGAMVSGNSESGISVTYDDATGKYNFDVNDPVISIDGDIAGSATMTNLGNVTINTGITAGVIVNADISGAAAIAASKIAGTAITAADTGTVNATILADLSVTTGKLVDTSVTTAKIADLNVTTGKIADSAITSAKIADATIVNADISTTAAIALSKLATDPLARANHTGTQTAATISNFDTQVQISRLDQMAAPTSSVSLNSQKITNLGTPTLSTDASTKAYVDSQITSLVGGAPGTLDTLNEIAAAINNSGSFATSVVLRDGTQAMTGNLAMGTNKITGLGTPTASTDAATKAYADSIIASAPSNLTGPITSVGAATSIASQTGTGTTFAMSVAPTLDTAVITASSTTDALRITNTGTGNSLLVEDSANPDASPFVIDNAGKVGIGVAPSENLDVAANGRTFIQNTRADANVNGPVVSLRKARGTISSPTLLSSADAIGQLQFSGYDGASYQPGVYITALTEGTPAAGSMPGILTINTTPSGSVSPVERMRINSAGEVGIGATTATGATVNIAKNITGATVAYGLVNQGVIQSDANSDIRYFQTVASTQAASFTLGNLRHYIANQGTIGAGSSITNQYGFFAAATLTGATNNYAFFGNLASASNTYNLYMAGTAANYFAGRTGIGATLTSGAMARVINTTASDVGFIIQGAASQTGDLLQIQDSAATVLTRVDSSGRIGIGTGPATDLDVARADGSSIRVRATTNAVDARLNTIGLTSNVGQVGTWSNHALVVRTNDTERMRIDASGNVGIGTSTPSTNLHIYNATNPILRLAAGSNTGLYVDYVNNYGGGFTVNGAYLMYFNVNGAERMRIDSSGNTTINSIAAGTTSTAAVGGGYMGLPQNSTTTGAYTVVAADAGKHIYSTATRTVTIDSNANLALPVGTTLTFVSGSGATTTIAITTDTMYLAGTGTTGSRTLAAFGMATAVKIASTTWIISGNGLT